VILIFYLKFWQSFTSKLSPYLIARNDIIKHRPVARSPWGSKLHIAACTCVRNDVPYLTEWIEFHRLQGFSNFFIFNDGSSDSVELVQRLYDQKFHGLKVVEVFSHDTPGHQPP
jgi:hypothetical protein